jgi:hypothetical protein
MHIQNKSTFVFVLAIVLAVLALVFMTADEMYVAAPGFASALMMIWLWTTLWGRDENPPFFDLGVFCALATCVYTVFPLVNYWMDGLQFGILSDYRLQNIAPSELGFFHLRHVLYLFSFVVFYSIFRGRGTIKLGNVSSPSRSAQRVIVVGFLMLTGYFLLLRLVTGFNLNASYEPNVFAQNLAALSSLPLILVQISYKLSGILGVFTVAMLLIVVAQCRKKTWLALLFLWIAAEIVQVIWVKGSRTGVVLLLLSVALLYHRLIKPLSVHFLVATGASLLAFFTFLGLYRTYSDVASLQSGLAQSEAGMFAVGNEFVSALGTTYDVFRMRAEGLEFPWYLYLNDFTTILPPQQLMPFEKLTASEWYLREIGISGTGLGLMWGVISQAIVGLDWLELFFRGAILGYVLGRIHSWYVKRQSGFLETLCYTYLCLKVYYTFRDTTGSLLTTVVWEIIPFYVILRVGVALQFSRMRGAPYHRIPLERVPREFGKVQ